MKLFTQFQFKIKATKSRKKLNFVLHDNYFTDLFTEVQIRYRKTFKFSPKKKQKNKNSNKKHLLNVC